MGKHLILAQGGGDTTEAGQTLVRRDSGHSLSFVTWSFCGAFLSRSAGPAQTHGELESLSMTVLMPVCARPRITLPWHQPHLALPWENPELSCATPPPAMH